jgi:hypothetical protein
MPPVPDSFFYFPILVKRSSVVFLVYLIIFFLALALLIIPFALFHFFSIVVDLSKDALHCLSLSFRADVSRCS